MKYFLMVLAVFCLSFAETPEEAVQRFFAISDDFGKEFKGLEAFPNDMHAYEVHYKGILKRLYRETMSDKILGDHLKMLEEVHLNSGAGVYLFPQVPEEMDEGFVTSNGHRARIEYDVTEKEVWSSMLDFDLGDGSLLKHIYKSYNVISPPFEKTFYGLSNLKGRKIEVGGDVIHLVEYEIYVTSPGKLIFYLKKTPSGWRVYDVQKKNSGSTLSWQETL